MTMIPLMTDIPNMTATSETQKTEAVEDDKPSRTQRRSLATRRKLLNAGRQVFSEKGFDFARIDDITERADVGKGTFYNYYQTKEELIQELVGNLLKDLLKNLKDDCRNITDLTELLDSLMATHIRFFSHRWEDFVLFFQGRTDLTLKQGYQGLETPFVNYISQLEKLISKPMKTKLPQNVLSRIACAVAGFVSGYYSFAVIATNDDDVDEVFKSLRGAMVASLVRFITVAVRQNQEEDK